MVPAGPQAMGVSPRTGTLVTLVVHRGSGQVEFFPQPSLAEEESGQRAEPPAVGYGGPEPVETENSLRSAVRDDSLSL
jgi:hypothetical protein